MPTTTTRRPLPAFAFLLALTILTVIVWWRVLHRDNGNTTTARATATATSQAPTCTPAGKVISLPKPSAVTIRVLNGNGQSGLAATVEGLLKSRGFVSAGTADAPSLVAGVAEIHFGPSAKNAGILLSLYLPGAKLVEVKRSSAVVDVVVGRTYQALATNAAVSSAGAKLKKQC